MKKIIVLANRLVLGYDTTIGVITYVILSTIFHENWNMYIFLFSLMMAYLPDFDLFAFFLYRKKMRIPSHWIIGHYPIFIFPIGICLSIFFSRGIGVDMVYVICIAIVAIAGHFYSDAVQPQGHDWLWPLSKRIYTLENGPHEVRPIVRLRHMVHANMKRKKIVQVQRVSGEINERLHAVTPEQFTAWLIAAAMLIFFIVKDY